MTTTRIEGWDLGEPGHPGASRASVAYRRASVSVDSDDDLCINAGNESLAIPGPVLAEVLRRAGWTVVRPGAEPRNGDVLRAEAHKLRATLDFAAPEMVEDRIVAALWTAYQAGANDTARGAGRE